MIEEDEDMRNNIRINWIGRIKIITKGIGFLKRKLFQVLEKNKNINAHMVLMLYVCFCVLVNLIDKFIQSPSFHIFEDWIGLHT